MARRMLIIATLPVVIGWSLLHRGRGPEASAQTQSSAVCPVPAPPCKDGAFPGIIQIIPDGSTPANKAKLARKRFYLASCPFNLAGSVSLTIAPTIRNYYQSAAASAQFISWLEENHCETIYCRPLTMGEVSCEGVEASRCVPEFNTAYRAALADLNGDANLALKMISNYPPLSAPKLRIGFYEAREEWFKTSVAKIESSVGKDYRLRSTVTDKEGVGFFYDLCPGTYYVSSVAPIDVDGVAMIWEAGKPIKVEGPPDKKDATKVTLAFAPSNKKNTIVGRPVSEFVKPADK